VTEDPAATVVRAAPVAPAEKVAEAVTGPIARVSWADQVREETAGPALLEVTVVTEATEGPEAPEVTEVTFLSATPELVRRFMAPITEAVVVAAERSVSTVRAELAEPAAIREQVVVRPSAGLRAPTVPVAPTPSLASMGGAVMTVLPDQVDPQVTITRSRGMIVVITKFVTHHTITIHASAAAIAVVAVAVAVRF
jgi:hypothetical protein